MNKANEKVLARLKEGNEIYVRNNQNAGDVSLAIRQKTAREGQHPYAIVITCSDSRVIPDAIFSAGNVLDNHQLGSIEYAFSHLDANVIVMLGHTKCGAISAAQHSHESEDKFIKYIIEDITEAIGTETDDYKATVLNVKHGVNIIANAFHDHPDIEDGELDVLGAVYDIETGVVEWI